MDKGLYDDVSNKERPINGLFALLPKDIFSMIMKRVYKKYIHALFLRSVCVSFRNYVTYELELDAKKLNTVVTRLSHCTFLIKSIRRSDMKMVRYTCEVFKYTPRNSYKPHIIKTGNWAIMRYLHDRFNWEYPQVEYVLKHSELVDNYSILEAYFIKLRLLSDKDRVKIICESCVPQSRALDWLIKASLFTEDMIQPTDENVNIEIASVFYQKNDVFWKKLQYTLCSARQLQNQHIINVITYCGHVYDRICFDPLLSDIHKNVTHICGCELNPKNKKIKN
jgi:hypothetical protein